MLKLYCSNQAIDIANQAVMKTIYTFYLEQYRKKLQGAVIDLSAQYNHLRSLEKNNNFWSYLKEAKRIKESCDETLGEAAYAKSLLAMSRASVRTRIYETLTALTSDLDRISVKCTDTYTITNNRFNNRLGIYGLVAGLLSIFLTITLELIKCSGPDGEDAYRDEYVRLKQRADSLNMENERILRQFEKINP